jgi:hypothetical protein
MGVGVLMTSLLALLARIPYAASGLRRCIAADKLASRVRPLDEER